MAIYRAQDLANRITNTEPIFGINSQSEGFAPSAIYSYNVIDASSWEAARLSDASFVGDKFRIRNSPNRANFDLTRTGVQYDAALTFIPVGLSIRIRIDDFIIPLRGSFKIRAYKGRPQDLTGASNENRIPVTTGYIPYSKEYIFDEDNTRIDMYLNSLATNDLIARAGKLNLFILGEWDYNNIPPNDAYGISYGGEDTNMSLTVFD
jgi:hypothetical protein